MVILDDFSMVDLQLKISTSVVVEQFCKLDVRVCYVAAPLRSVAASASRSGDDMIVDLAGRLDATGVCGSNL